MFLRILNLQAGVCLTYICIFTQMFINDHHFSLKKCLCDYLFSLFKQSLWFFKFKQSYFKYAYISIFLKKERKSHFFLRTDRLNIMKRFWKNSDGKWNIVLHICIKGIPITDELFSYKLSQFYYFPILLFYYFYTLLLFSYFIILLFFLV